MWTEGLVKIVGDRSESGGKYVVANVDIPPGKFSDLKGLNNIINKIRSYTISLRYSDSERETSGGRTQTKLKLCLCSML